MRQRSVIHTMHYGCRETTVTTLTVEKAVYLGTVSPILGRSKEIGFSSDSSEERKNTTALHRVARFFFDSESAALTRALMAQRLTERAPSASIWSTSLNTIIDSVPKRVASAALRFS